MIFKVISKSVTEAPERSGVKTLVKEFSLTPDRSSILKHPLCPRGVLVTVNLVAFHQVSFHTSIVML